MGLSVKNTRSADFYADRIDVITNFAVITNALIKRIHCNYNVYQGPVFRTNDVVS